MPRKEIHPRRRLLLRQRRAAERLRREVMLADGSLGHAYFRPFLRRQRGYRRRIEAGDLVAAAALADLIYVGDYHAQPACQAFAADLLEQIARRTPRLALGIEFVYTRQQRLLDRRQQRQIGDSELLRRLHYREEWGYPWEGYRTLLDRARELGIPVHAIDVPPRGGFDGLRRRDEHAARRIAAILCEQPDTRLLVLFGESHLARSHLPRRVKSQLKRAGLERREVVILQNPDPVYWRLVAEGGALPRAVQLDDNGYAVLHGTSPLEKYEAYRQVLERWREEVPPDEEVDLTPAVHHLIVVLLGWLGLRADRRVRHRAGWTDCLIDAFPEVYGGTEAVELLQPILAEHGRSVEERREAALLLARRGALYEPRSNTLFLTRYLPGPAAGEAARFLRAALTGRLFIAALPDEGDRAASAYGAAFNEALAHLGSRLVDPTWHYSPVERATLPAPAAGASLHAGTARRWLRLHRQYEASREPQAPERLLERLRQSRPLRRELARDLGARLGGVLFERVRRGELDQRSLRQLFTRPLQPPQAARLVLQLLRSEARPTGD